jgi:hypothetical protein
LTPINQLVPVRRDTAAAPVAACGDCASLRFPEFFAANIGNPHIRLACCRAAAAAAEQLGFPVALKVNSPDIRHKTEAGVVRANLGDAAQVRTAYSETLASAKAYAPHARIIGVSVQEMVGDSVEVIVGVSCDPQLGPVLLFVAA